MKTGAVVAIFFGAIAGIALTLHLTAMKTLSSFEPTVNYYTARDSD